jgi:hypothetical protein
MTDMHPGRSRVSLVIALSLLVAAAVSPAARAREITLENALDMAVNGTARGNMIQGNLEVAEQNYFARRINFYVPEVFIKGSLPAYSVDESYRFFGGATEKRLYTTRDLGYNAYIELNQNLLTGGDVIITANLLARQDRYPNTRPDAENSFINEIARQGYFTFSYTQPILKPSDPKYTLNNTKDDLDIATLTRAQEETALKKEVIEAFIGVLQVNIREELYECRVQSADLQAEIDSMKLLDEIISEEDWLLSASQRLDAELDKFQIDTEKEEKKRDLFMLLDVDAREEISPFEPVITEHINDQTKGYDRRLGDKHSGSKR